MPSKTYSEQVDIENTYRLRQLLEDMPSYVKDYFRGIQPRTQSRTRVAYAYDLSVFFKFLHDYNPELGKKSVSEISLNDLENLKPVDIEEYLEYLQAYDSKNNEVKSNHELGLKRKLASLRSFFRYYIKHEEIKYNPVELVELPKIHEKSITRFDIDEVASFLDNVETGENLTKKQQTFHNITAIRDTAMMTLMLGTGIRVSECVGLNISDVDFRNNGIKIHRKGGKEVIVYFGDEVEKALKEYIEERKLIHAVTVEDEDALFLSIQKKRISVRAVEKMVKKYAQTVTTVKHITPHKLRSTYGTSLYRETGDIYLVADVLGHSDVNTTKKHYAAIEDDRRRSARNVVHLREDN